MSDLASRFPALPWSQMPPWPRSDGNPLTGWQRARFVLVLWRHGHLTVRSFQRSDGEVLVDGLVGVQTWVTFWARVRQAGT